MKKGRIRKAVRILKQENVDALLITDMVTIRYLSGFTGSEASVIITPEAFFVLVDSRYTTQARREAPLFHISRISKRAEDTAKLISRLKIKKAGFDAKSITFADHEELQEKLTRTSLVPVREPLAKLRARKERDEVDIIRQGTALAASGFNQIKNQIQAGTAERDVALALEFALRKAGAEKMSFDTIVASGKRSALPHGIASDKEIRAGEFVTIDFGIQYKGYCTDETCTVITGSPTQKQKKVYGVVKEAHDRAIDKIKPGASTREVDGVAREHIERKGFGKYFGHGTGHGVGLSVHEEPRLSPVTNEILEEGMIVTVEPGIYIPNWGGVRIEDMVLVTRDSRAILTVLPKKLEVLN
jgi:Xaa-Pro aminopeptidase